MKQIRLERAIVVKVDGGFQIRSSVAYLGNETQDISGGPIESTMARPDGSDATVVLRGGTRTVQLGRRMGNRFAVETSLTTDGGLIMLKKPRAGVLGIRYKGDGEEYITDIVSLVDVPEARRTR